jgi:uncharacterized membrane protein YwzB
MNKTQKGAWVSLIISLLFIAINIWAMSTSNFNLTDFEQRTSRGLPMWLGFIVAVAAVVFMRRKQSPAETGSDERDELIKRRAVLVSFVAVWVLLIIACVIPRFIVGKDGSIPVSILPLIVLGIVLIVLSIFSAAVLVQYGRKEEHHE